MAMATGCRYEEQLREASRLVASGVAQENWQLVYQSRSGPPQQPWLEPDVGDYIERVQESAGGLQDVVVVPIGFISDHVEVLYDLDTEVRQLCERAWHQYGASGDCRHAPSIRANDPRACR